MNTGFSVSVSKLNGTATLHLAGELDIATAPQLREALTDVDGSLVVDLGRLTFIDAIGIEELARVARRSTLEIRGASPFVRRVLTLVDLEHLISPASVR
jgi:anti-anti-sigma factor